ncbi:MAG: glycosyltransferase family 4 protein [Beijerinckiaceae bacterium]
MKVLALVTDAFGAHGGIAQYNRDLLTAVAGMPSVTQVDILTRVAPFPLQKMPVNARQWPAVQDKIRYSLLAANLAKSLRPDLVFNGHLYHGSLAVMLAKALRARLVSQLHGTEIWQPLRKPHRLALQKSDLVLTVSRDTFARLSDQIASARYSGAVLANTVRPEFCPGDRAAARSKFGLHDGVKALLSVSRLDTREGYKGHDRIIRLLPGLRGAGRNVVYLISGLGDDRVRLEALAHEEGVADHVRFLGGVSTPDLPDLYRAADLFVLPSTGEGFGIVYIEAMACGTPALGLRVGGAPDALGDGELGWCVEPDDLAEAVAAALDAPRPDAQALHDAVQARFGQDVFRARVADLIGSLQ